MRPVPAALLVALVCACGSGNPARPPAERVHVLTGSIAGAPYLAEYPVAWNRTLVLYSHGYVAPGSASPALDASDRFTASWLLDNGYALAGSGYRSAGWAVGDGVADQVALLDRLAARQGTPRRVVAWGHSLGGMITAALAQAEPGRVAGALPMCGVLAGGTATWDSGLDGEFAFRSLLAGGAPLQLTAIRDPVANSGLAGQVLDEALKTPIGRARLGLVAAIAGLPSWFDPSAPPPSDPAGQVAAQARWERTAALPFAFAYRAEMEARAGGNPSSNQGVDYTALLARSPSAGEVHELYGRAGAALDADLDVLARAPRVSAEPAAAAWLAANFTFSGAPPVPVITLHTTDDGLVISQQESAYPAERRAFVHRPGHCNFSPGEMLATLQALFHRLDTGAWGDTGPQALAAAALALGPDFNQVPALRGPLDAGRPAFTAYTPAPMPRVR